MKTTQTDRLAATLRPTPLTLTLALTLALALALGACGGGSGGGGGAPSALTLTSVQPIEGTTAGGTEVTIYGSGFLAIQDTIGAIHFGGIAAPSFAVLGDTVITCTTPAGPLGNVNVQIVRKGDGHVLLTGGFRYVAPIAWVADGEDPALANLYRVDLHTGHVTTIGPMGYALAGLASSPDGVLFGVEDGALHRLMEVDPATGAATPTGLLEDQDTGVEFDVRDITFVGDRLIGRTTDGEMVEIDQTYGFVTVLQDLTPPPFGDGIAASGPATVALSPLGSGGTLRFWDADTLGLTSGPVVSAVFEGTVDAMAFDEGFLYALDADLTSTLSAVLLRIDPATGQTATITASLSARARAVTQDR